jgi:hypothetical protein
MKHFDRPAEGKRESSSNQKVIALNLQSLSGDNGCILFDLN